MLNVCGFAENSKLSLSLYGLRLSLCGLRLSLCELRLSLQFLRLYGALFAGMNQMMNFNSLNS